MTPAPSCCNTRGLTWHRSNESFSDGGSTSIAAMNPFQTAGRALRGRGLGVFLAERCCSKDTTNIATLAVVAGGGKDSDGWGHDLGQDCPINQTAPLWCQ